MGSRANNIAEQAARWALWKTAAVETRQQRTELRAMCHEVRAVRGIVMTIARVQADHAARQHAARERSLSGTDARDEAVVPDLLLLKESGNLQPYRKPE